jgi:hypothetical protein
LSVEVTCPTVTESFFIVEYSSTDSRYASDHETTCDAAVVHLRQPLATVVLIAIIMLWRCGASVYARSSQASREGK